MKQKSKVFIFLDDAVRPIGEFEVPIQFDLDTRKLPDGDHILKIVGQEPTGKEGIRIIPFTVRNGPAISVEGLKTNDVVDGVLPIMVNAYGKGDQKQFLIDGSETPRSIPSWVWALIIGFTGWAVYYAISNYSI
ncbi:MAG TPA: hypothetical protein VKZ68_02255 [Ohtaekwangia sp.]|nr:hypothetical protein [Ohtaekwangia sp.]